MKMDRVILHTVMHHSSTSTYIPTFIQIEETFCGRTDVRTGGWTFETHFIRSTQRSRPKNVHIRFKHYVEMVLTYLMKNRDNVQVGLFMNSESEDWSPSVTT